MEAGSARAAATEAAEAELAAMHGAAWTHEDSEAMVGSALTFAAETLRNNGVEGTDEEIIGFLADRVIASMGESVPWQPGAVRLLTELRDAGVPCALVTMSYREIAEVILADAPDGAFVVSVTGDEVANGKPHPEPYLRAAELLGVDIAECVAVEDSPATAAAANNSSPRRSRIRRMAFSRTTTEIAVPGLIASPPGKSTPVVRWAGQADRRTLYPSPRPGPERERPMRRHGSWLALLPVAVLFTLFLWVVSLSQPGLLSPAHFILGFIVACIVAAIVRGLLRWLIKPFR